MQLRSLLSTCYILLNRSKHHHLSFQFINITPPLLIHNHIQYYLTGFNSVHLNSRSSPPGSNSHGWSHLDCCPISKDTGATHHTTKRGHLQGQTHDTTMPGRHLQLCSQQTSQCGLPALFHPARIPLTVHRPGQASRVRLLCGPICRPPLRDHGLCRSLLVQ